TRARLALGAGVTLILDKGWGDDTVIRAVDALAPEERPEIEAAARILAVPGGYYEDFALEIEPEEIGPLVRRQAAAGKGWVKIIGDWPRRGMGPMPNFTEDELRRAVAEADDVGARVAVHTMAREVPSQAVAAGVHSIEHGLFLSEDDLSVLGARGGMWVPTLLRNEATMADLGPESSGRRLFMEGLQHVRALLPLAIEAGVEVLAGTDLAGAPADVAAEALRLIDYGLSGAQAVAAVSTSGFRATDRDFVFAPGAPSNAVFFAADPVTEPAVLAHPSAVIRLGRLL
ncbi:MAG: amidohydrolase family protein, partial [Acidimicrobiia bacterium]